MERENIFQMYTRLGRVGFFVKRNSWSHPKAAAQIISIGGQTSGPLPGKPPYHNEPPSWKSPKVLAAISYRGEPPRVEELTSPGTYAYELVDPPDEWTST